MTTLYIGDVAYPDFDDWDIQELRALKRETGLTLKQFGDAVAEGDVDALTVMVWLLQRRTNPELTVDDVHFRITELRYEDDSGKG